MRRLLAMAVLLVGVFMIPPHADSTPLNSVQSSQKCDTCHVEPDPSDPRWVEENYSLADRKCSLSCSACHLNPTGGMVRNRTGLYYGTHTLNMVKVPQDFVPIAGKLSDLGETVMLGGDFRTLHLFTNQSGRTESYYFPMQADLYVGVRLMKYLSLQMQTGMERGGNTAVREYSALVHGLPYNLYAKAGRFIPPYGLRLEDHTAYIRNATGLDQSDPDSYYGGLEFGIEPLVVYAQAAYFYEDSPPRARTGNIKKGFSAMAGWRGLWLQLGGSLMKVQNYEVDTVAPSTTDREMYGASGSLRFRNISYVFELDRIEDKTDTSGSISTLEKRVGFNELDYLIIEGLNLKLRYETIDPDPGKGGDKTRRRTAAVDIRPYPFMDASFQYRRTEAPGEKFKDYLAMMHFWF
jgi:hypothetical protein